MKKKIVVVICILLAFALCFAACNKKGKSTTGETSFVAKVNGAGIPRSLFFSCFMESLDEVYYSSPDNLDFDDFGTEDFYNAIATEKNTDGEIYIDALIDEAIEKARYYMVNRELAKADSSWPTASEIAEAEELAEEELSTNYSIYVEYYGYTLDYICYSLYGMPVDDYASLSAIESAVGLFNDAYMKALTVSDEDVEAFYQENKEAYTIVTVRHSLFMKDDDMTEEETEELIAKVNDYLTKYNNGEMTFDELCELSEDSGVDDNDGYYDVVADNTYVQPFQDWAVSRTEVSDVAEIVESDYGYHIMICTAIKGFDDDTVKANAEEGYRESLLEEKINSVLEDGKHNATDKDETLAKQYVKMVITGNFTDPDATATPEVTATPKPEYDDAEASTDVIAKVGDDNLWVSDYTYFFSSAISEILTPVISFDGCDTTAERYQVLKDFLDTKYPDSDKDETYLEYCERYALELQLQFQATWLMAKEAGNSKTEEEIAEENEEIDEMLDQYLSYYGDYYGVSTRDEYVDYIMGMNVNEYKRFNEKQSLLSDYANEQVELYGEDDEACRKYYEDNLDYYRVVTVRHIDITVGGENAADLEAAKTLAESLKNKLLAGDSPAALVLAWSEASDAEDGGLEDMTSSSSSLSDEITEWALKQTEIGTSTVQIFETEDTVSIVYVAGIVTYDEATGEQASEDVTAVSLQDSVKEAYGSEQFQNAIEQYIVDKGLVATDVDQTKIDACAEKYLTYEEEEEED